MKDQSIQIPLLEFDLEEKAIINPNDLMSAYSTRLPERLIICFFLEVIEELVQTGIIEPLLTINGEQCVHFYRFIDCDLALVHGHVGAPAMAGVLEDAIGLGAKTILFCGGGGIIDKRAKAAGLVVVNSAIRDEGTSYHYLPASPIIEANSEVVSALVTFLQANSISHISARVWTTDAFYRETPKRVMQRQAEGAVLVEMEQAALIAVSQWRKVKYGAIIYAGDDLTGVNYDSANWRKRITTRRDLVTILKQVAFTL